MVIDPIDFPDLDLLTNGLCFTVDIFVHHCPLLEALQTLRLHRLGDLASLLQDAVAWAASFWTAATCMAFSFAMRLL